MLPFTLDTVRISIHVDHEEMQGVVAGNLGSWRQCETVHALEMLAISIGEVEASPVE